MIDIHAVRDLFRQISYEDFQIVPADARNGNGSDLHFTQLTFHLWSQTLLRNRNQSLMTDLKPK